MISGTDFVLPAPSERDGIADCLSAIRNFWPDAVVELGDRDAALSAIADFAPSESDELFVYRDARAAEAWEQDGGTPELLHLMIHLLRDNEEITIVVGDPGQPETAMILNAICKSLGLAELPQPPAGSDSRRAG